MPSKENIFKNSRMLRKRFNISKMRGNKYTFRIIKRESEKRFGTNTIKTTEEIEYEIKSEHEGTTYQQEK